MHEIVSSEPRLEQWPGKRDLLLRRLNRAKQGVRLFPRLWETRSIWSDRYSPQSANIIDAPAFYLNNEGEEWLSCAAKRGENPPYAELLPHENDRASLVKCNLTWETIHSPPPPRPRNYNSRREGSLKGTCVRFQMSKKRRGKFESSKLKRRKENGNS